MNISQHLPQFTHDTALFIVTGEHDARLYLAQNGELTTLDAFEVGKPHYTDREGHFKTRGPGIVVRSGAVYEEKKPYLLMNFLHELARHIQKTTRGLRITQVYLFAPHALRQPVRKILPKPLRERIRLTIGGNYCQTHPFELLAMIEDKLKEKVVTPTTDEARTLLDRDRM